MASQLVSVLDYEQHASRILPHMIHDYYRGGADDEQSLRDNRAAFKRWRLLPKMLRGVSQRKMDTTALGYHVKAPFGIAPTAMQRMAHPDGECATAKAAADHGIVFTLSTLATSSIEQIAAVAPHGTNWFQLYIYKDRQATANLVKRAEQSGFKALVLTVDTPYLGRRLENERVGFSMPSHLKLGNFTSENKATFSNQPSGGSLFAKYIASMFDPSLSWEDIAWLKSITTLPIVAKGILTPDDAELAIQHGVAAIQVSNHGGRQLDGVQASIDALPAIVEQVRGRCEVYVDGGAIKGTDILKAIALGARMVFVGRPALWGLAHSGEEGVRKVIQLLKDELGLAMALSGCALVEDINRSLVIRQEYGSEL